MYYVCTYVSTYRYEYNIFSNYPARNIRLSGEPDTNAVKIYFHPVSRECVKRGTTYLEDYLEQLTHMGKL